MPAAGRIVGTSDWLHSSFLAVQQIRAEAFLKFFDFHTSIDALGTRWRMGRIRRTDEVPNLTANDGRSVI